MRNTLKSALIVPTLNAGSSWQSWINAFHQQVLKPDDVFIIDSASEDNTVSLAKAAGFHVHQIRRAEFNHGKTRQIGVEHFKDVDIIIFLTQDALLADPDTIEKLLISFEDPKVGAAYGRQLPHEDANPIAAHARLFNYPLENRIKSMVDAPELGIKTAFISNSFAAYRRTALMEVGAFPSNTILCEDTYVAAKMLLAGWKIAYVADARVYHSHNYSIIEEFRRYFDLGVFHAREPWIRESFGQAEGEGLRYIKSELSYLFKNNPSLFPSSTLRTALKLFGYRLGFLEGKLPISIKRHISMHKGYWLK